MPSWSPLRFPTCCAIYLVRVPLSSAFIPRFVQQQQQDPEQAQTFRWSGDDAFGWFIGYLISAWHDGFGNLAVVGIQGDAALC